MASRAVYIAQQVAEQIGQTVWDWPVNIVPTTPDRLNTVVPVRAYVLPVFARVATEEPQVAVSPISVEMGDIRDTCGRKWNTLCEIAAFKKLKDTGSSEVQPGNLDEIDWMLELGEAIRDFVDVNRSVLDISMVEMMFNLFNEDHLRNDHILVTQTDAYYR